MAEATTIMNAKSWIICVATISVMDEFHPSEEV
jgi:hypothetical protein